MAERGIWEYNREGYPGNLLFKWALCVQRPLSSNEDNTGRLKALWPPALCVWMEDQIHSWPNKYGPTDMSYSTRITDLYFKSTHSDHLVQFLGLCLLKKAHHKHCSICNLIHTIGKMPNKCFEWFNFRLPGFSFDICVHLYLVLLNILVFLPYNFFKVCQINI